MDYFYIQWKGVGREGDTYTPLLWFSGKRQQQINFWDDTNNAVIERKTSEVRGIYTDAKYRQRDNLS